MNASLQKNPENTDSAGSRLQFFPISFFTAIMGLGGFSVALGKYEKLSGMTSFLSTLMSLVTLALFCLFLLIYLAKFIRYRKDVREEWGHPLKISFFPAITISMLILAIAFKPLHLSLASALWWAGASLNLLLTLFVVQSWMRDNHFQPDHLSPVWFIPVVGNILAPIAGMSFAPPELNWFLFTTGFMFWMLLLPLLMYRFVFGSPIPAPMRPGLFILIAPPALGCLSYSALTNGQIEAFSAMMYNMALLFFLILLVQFRQFFTAPFSLSWWGYSFPLAALTLSSFHTGEVTGTQWFITTGMGLFWLLVLIISLLVVRTVLAGLKGKICVPN